MWPGYVYAAVFPFLLVLGPEMLNTPDSTPRRPGLGGGAAVVSGLFVFYVYAAVAAVTGSVLAAGVVCAALFGAFYVFAYYRLVITGWVFVPKDLSLFRQAKEMAGFTKLTVFPAVVAVIAVVAGLVVVLGFAAAQVELSGVVRLVLFGVAAADFVFLFCTKVARRVVLPIFGVDVDRFEHSNKTYREIGVLMGFYCNLVRGEQRLEGYSSDKMESVVRDVKLRGTPPLGGVPPTGGRLKAARNYLTKTPDVIIVMSEAFSDLGACLGHSVRLSREPMANFKSLDAVKGEVIVPVIGGRTCNTEFEFLTGNAMEFIGMDIMPFEWEQAYVPKNDTRALPNLFRENGYETVSVHPFKGAFFNRSTIHPKLGFDRCIFAEHMHDAVKKGDYISDEYFTGRVLGIIEEHENEKPLFLYGITMQNHYHYYRKKYERYDVLAEGELPQELLWRLSAYLQGVYDADAQLARLVAALKKRERPTILLFFGDHKPLLGKTNFELYRKTGVLQSSDYTLWTAEQTRLMFSAPYALWNNFNMPKQEWGDVSAYKLGALTAGLAGLELNLFYEFLTAYTEDDAELLRYIQYDKIHGEGYVDVYLTGVSD